MKRTLLLLIVTGAALLLGLTAPMALAGSKAEGTIRIESGTGFVGETVEVDVIVDVGPPGLGAWTFDVSYDPDVISTVGCTPYHGGLCGLVFADDADRLTGASRDGLIGQQTMFTMSYRCGDHPGTSELSISVEVFADATPDNPQDITEDVTEGAVACVGRDTEPGVIRIESAIGVIGEEVTLRLRGEDIPAPGLGAWTVNVEYDPAHVTLVGCEPTGGGVCEESYRPEALRVIGASATGLTGTFTLAEILFRCADSSGSSLLVSTEFFGIFPPGGPPVPESAGGSITCVALDTSTLPPVLPPAGSGSSGSSMPPWPLLALIAFGAATTSAAIALRGRAPLTRSPFPLGKGARGLGRSGQGDR